MYSSFNKTANRDESDSNSYMDKTCTKSHDITIPDINMRTTKSHNNPLYRKASEYHIQTILNLKLKKKHLLANYTASHPQR
jgi:hypothetical protein